MRWGTRCDDTVGCRTVYDNGKPAEHEPSPHELYAKLAAHHGALIYLEEALALHAAARGACFALEIGAYKGASTVMIAHGMLGGVLLSIDPHGGVADTSFSQAAGGSTIEALHRALQLLPNPRVAVLPYTSKAALPLVTDLRGDRLFDLVFIDGSHLKEDVLFDLVNYAERVRVGGILAVDDIAMPPVAKAWEEWKPAEQGFVPIDPGATWGVYDGVHGREASGRVHKMQFMTREHR